MIEIRGQLNTDRILRELEERAWQGIQRATIYYWQKLEEALNVPNPGERRKSRTRKTPKGRPASFTVYPSPSRPGEPPRKRTGWLQRNVVYSLDRSTLSAKVGVTVNAKYGLYLDLGTRTVEARPWLQATLQKHESQVRALLLKG